MPRARKIPKSLVGGILAKLREERGLNQDELASRCQVAGWYLTRVGVSKIETGLRNVADYEVVKLAQVLGCAVTDLLPKETNVDRWLKKVPKR